MNLEEESPLLWRSSAKVAVEVGPKRVVMSRVGSLGDPVPVHDVGQHSIL